MNQRNSHSRLEIEKTTLADLWRKVRCLLGLAAVGRLWPSDNDDEDEGEENNDDDVVIADRQGSTPVIIIIVKLVLKISSVKKIFVMVT